MTDISSARPTMFFLAGLEVGAHLVDAVSFALVDQFDCVPLDVPDASSTSDEARTALVLSAIRRHGSSRWLLAAHGPHGRIVQRAAEKTLGGEAGLFGFAGLILVSSDPDSAAGADFPLLTVSVADDVASAVRTFWADRAGTAPVIPADLGRTIASGRTSSRTRSILAWRSLADDPAYAPSILSPSQLSTLRAVADRAVPQPDAAIDLAARVDAGLADGASDGWRNAAMPADADAYRQALDVLEAFGELSHDEQDARLASIAAGEYEPEGSPLDAEQLQLWFEDCRVDLVRLWLGHPATMARIVFDGFANGGDLVRIQGFLKVRADEREDWEPSMGRTR